MKVLRLCLMFFPLVAISCFQNEEIFIAENKADDPAYLYHQPVNNPAQFILTIDEGTQYYSTKNKNLLKIPKGSILDETGNYFKGNLIIEIIETKQLGEYILHGKYPVSQNEALDSKWLLYLRFSSEGKELSINPNIPVEWFSNMESKATEFNLYKEVTSENKIKNWIKNSTSLNEEWSIERQDYIERGKGTTFTITEPGWYLVGNSIAPSASNENICIEVPQKFNLTNSIFFAISNEQNLVLPLRHNTSNGIICEDDILNPFNSGIKFVLISYQDDGKHYYAELFTSVKTGQLDVLTPRPYTLDDIISKVKGL